MPRPSWPPFCGAGAAGFWLAAAGMGTRARATGAPATSANGGDWTTRPAQAASSSGGGGAAGDDRGKQYWDKSMFRSSYADPQPRGDGSGGKRGGSGGSWSKPWSGNKWASGSGGDGGGKDKWWEKPREEEKPPAGQPAATRPLPGWFGALPLAAFERAWRWTNASRDLSGLAFEREWRRADGSRPPVLRPCPHGAGRGGSAPKKATPTRRNSSHRSDRLLR